MQFHSASIIPAPRAGRALTLGLAIAAALSAGQALAVTQSQQEHAQHHADQQTTPPTGQRWATDAPLQDGMARIRQAVTMLEHLQMGHVDPRQAPAFADQIQSAVNDMIANCKLAPDADAALHGLLVKFIAGADAVRTGPVTLDELKPMQDALAQYPALFDDPTWGATPED